MKKLLFILAIGAFAACNDAGDTSTEGSADTSINAGSTDTLSNQVDTSAAGSAIDTTTKTADTLNK
jgi:hypothetical protein